MATPEASSDFYHAFLLTGIMSFSCEYRGLTIYAMLRLISAIKFKVNHLTS